MEAELRALSLIQQTIQAAERKYMAAKPENQRVILREALESIRQHLRNHVPQER